MRSDTGKVKSIMAVVLLVAESLTWTALVKGGVQRISGWEVFGKPR